MRYRLTVMGLSFLAAASCSQHKGAQLSISSGKPDVATLTRTAERYWKAKVSEDWEAVFEYTYAPMARAQLARDEFTKWSRENEPFVIHQYQLEQVEVEEDMGWVEIDYKTSIRRYPTLPPRDARLAQKWHWNSGHWYPVSPPALDNFPEPPSRRDHAQEARLRERFLEAWEARRSGDWKRLYLFSDPNDREDVTEEMFGEAEGMFIYLSHKILWVQAIGDRGRIMVTYHHKVADSSMQKLGTQDLTIHERWILRGNEWYRDLKKEQ